MQRLSFTTTATLRPEVLARTYESFEKNLKGVRMKECVLHLNVDPVPNSPRFFSRDVLNVAWSFFGQVRVRMTDKPNFASAVKWCWSQPMGDYFFHLEDDWELTEPIGIARMVALLAARQELACVSLRAYDHTNLQDDRICLSPGLFRTDAARAIALNMVDTVNPEKQLRPRTELNVHGGRQGLWTGIQIPDRPILKDIGREWLEKSGWKKQNGDVFNQWEKE